MKIEISLRIRSLIRIFTERILDSHYENTPFQMYRKFHIKNWNFSDKKLSYFHISAQNIGHGYSLEPPRRGGSNEYPQSMLF